MRHVRNDRLLQVKRVCQSLGWRLSEEGLALRSFVTSLFVPSHVPIRIRLR